MNLHLEKHTGFVIFHLVSLMECFLCSRKAERNLLDCYYPRKITLTYNFNDKKEDFFITHHKCVIFAHLTVKQMTLKGIHLISYMCVCVRLVAQLCPTLVTPQTVAYQGPLSMGFSRQKTGVGFHFLLQGIFLTQQLNLSLVP